MQLTVPAGNVYIADAGNNTVRKITSSAGVITTIAGKGPGSLGYSGDGGLASAAKFYAPYDVAVDQSRNVYIADSQNHSIRKIAATTGIISTIAGTGPANAGFTGDGGPATSAKLNSPQGVTVDAFENVFIVTQVIMQSEGLLRPQESLPQLPGPELTVIRVMVGQPHYQHFMLPARLPLLSRAMYTLPTRVTMLFVRSMQRLE